MKIFYRALTTSFFVSLIVMALWIGVHNRDSRYFGPFQSSFETKKALFRLRSAGEFAFGKLEKDIFVDVTNE